MLSMLAMIADASDARAADERLPRNADAADYAFDIFRHTRRRHAAAMLFDERAFRRRYAPLRFSAPPMLLMRMPPDSRCR